MSVPARDPRRAEAARRFASLPLSELIAAWEERHFDTERVLLAEELGARGYRVKSLPLPTDDVPDSDPDPAAEARTRWTAENADEDRQRPRSGAGGGAVACYLIAAVTLTPLGSGHLEVGQEDPPFFGFMLLALAALFVVLGRAISRGSKLAAFTALVLYGLNFFGRIRMATEAETLSEGGTWLRLGIALVFFLALARSASAMSKRSSDEIERQDGSP